MSYYATGGGTIEFEKPIEREGFEYHGLWELFWDSPKSLWVQFDGVCGDELFEDLEHFAKLGIRSMNVEMTGEDAQHWRWRWNGKSVVEDVGCILYDDGDMEKLSYDRLLQLFTDYVSKDYDDCASGEGLSEIYGKLKRIGCSDDEIKATGLDWIIE